jgi:hypothetical protein
LKLRLPKPYIKSKPTPKQAAWLMYDGLEGFYGGAAGGGKSEGLLMGALQYVDVPNYSALILRRSYTDLALAGALMDRARSWLQDTPATWNRETHSWHFPSGASLTFGYIATDADRFRYQSAEFQYIAWDEITEFESDIAYTFMFSRLRTSGDLRGKVPLRMRSASNPVGPGVGWVRPRFIENIPEPFRLEEVNGTYIEVPDPSQRLFLPATFKDNEHLDAASYLFSLKQLPEATQERLIQGSWEAIDGAAFPHWNPAIHVVPSMRLPQDWRRWEAMDYGTSNPTAWYAAAISPEGYAVIYDEYYSPGLISQHASAVLTRRHNSWGQPSIALCDPSVQARTGFGTHGKGETVHSEFAKHGIFLVPANNDRRAGLVRIAEALRADPTEPFPEWHPLRLNEAGEVRYGAPNLYITENCPVLIDQIKYAPLDPKDGEIIEPFWEGKHGHAMAAARYLMTARIYSSEGLPNEDPFTGRRTLVERTPESTWRNM